MTSVARIDPPSKSAAIREQLPPSIREKIEEARARNAIVQQIRGNIWAKDYSDAVIRSVAEYGYRHGIDPVTELEILGGRVYRNAVYYRRKGAEMMAAGLVSSVETDHVAHDARLDEIAATATQYATDAEKASDANEAGYWREQARQARREVIRRKNERVRVGAPEKAAAVVVVRIVTPWLVEPIEGANWAGGGMRSNDPVGNAEPTKTAESRALRRAWMNLVEAGSKVQAAEAVQAFVRREVEADSDAELVEATVDAEAESIVAGHEAARPHALSAPADYYASEPTAESQTELLPSEPPRARTSMEPD